MTADNPALADAFAHLTRRDYARAELGRRLRRRGHTQEAIKQALDRCQELGYLDDRAFARARAQGLLQRRPSGRIAVLRDLRRQGVPSTMGEQVVDEIYAEAGGERQVLADALQRWLARHGAPADWRAARRAADHLSRRGFSGAAVREALSPWLDDISG